MSGRHRLPDAEGSSGLTTHMFMGSQDDRIAILGVFDSFEQNVGCSLDGEGELDRRVLACRGHVPH
jgi:hypothetical protein